MKMKIRIGDKSTVIGEIIGIIWGDHMDSGGWKEKLYVFYTSPDYFVSPKIRAASIEFAFSGEQRAFQAVYKFYNVPTYETA